MRPPLDPQLVKSLSKSHMCPKRVMRSPLDPQLIKSLPRYYKMARECISQGKVTEDVVAWIWRPLLDIKNLDYKDLSTRKLNGFQEWLLEKYLDFVESIWPYHCITIPSNIIQFCHNI
ncbi:hypothetical protein SAY87_001723 [Trapa incisa]|uniref:Uncharacterized protein n=1 Tax=Trapa incisa TaxID=236973 RepID=A0AAN7PTN3_9MYRT|nr:hypothetical protein SAY87_001723 [Trapa incisa]